MRHVDFGIPAEVIVALEIAEVTGGVLPKGHFHRDFAADRCKGFGRCTDP
jgi:hypothetical protein